MNEPLLSIICPGLVCRAGQFSILAEIERQIGDDPRVELLVLSDNKRWSIGRKMNALIALARGQYVAGVGDDDEVAPDYVSTLVAALEANPGVDCVSFDHEYWQDGVYRAVIKESKDFEYCNNWDAGLLTRSPSNKMAFRRELVAAFTYPHEWHGEDTQFARWAKERIETEHRIDRVLYKYMYRRDNAEGKRFRGDRKQRGFN